MREFATPFEERQRIARIQRERYHRDPEYRLRKINRSRAGFGLPPRASVDEILTPEEKRRVLSDLAKQRDRRDGKFA